MTEHYIAYLNHLRSFADNVADEEHTENTLYPFFTELKQLIGHYRGTIEKFDEVQNFLARIISENRFNQISFDFYRKRFQALQNIDNSLQELKSKKIPASISTEVHEFISKTYSCTGLTDLDTIEERVLSYHNKIAETERSDDENSGCYRGIAILVAVILFIAFVISKCN